MELTMMRTAMSTTLLVGTFTQTTTSHSTNALSQRLNFYKMPYKAKVEILATAHTVLATWQHAPTTERASPACSTARSNYATTIYLYENDEGTTASAVKAIQYATKMGAKVMSNSWGGEGEDPSEAADNQALRDAIKAAGDAGILFVAAAGNGHGDWQGNGYDNDTDPKPGYPGFLRYS